MQFNEGGNLEAYVLKHEGYVEELLAAGKDISDKRRVIQLHASVPPKLDAALQYYDRLEDDEKTYEAYCKKLIEIYGRVKAYYHKLQEDEKPIWRKCYECGSPTHMAHKCPNLKPEGQGLEKKPMGEIMKNDNTNLSKAEVKESGKPDWTKFTSFSNSKTTHKM